MLKLDHLTVIAPTLQDGVSHVQTCLDLEIPFGTRHEYMGTHNHRLQLGNNVYLEIVALDSHGITPARSRWFGLDDQKKIKSDWDAGLRLRGWVAATKNIHSVVSTRRAIFGDVVDLPTLDPTFCFAIPTDGSLPLDGAVPSLIDHRDDPTSMASIPDLGARLRSFMLQHPDPAAIESLYRELSIDHPPQIIQADTLRYQAEIDTPTGLRTLT